MLCCPNRSAGGRAGHIRKRKATTNPKLSRVRGPRNAALGSAEIPDQVETPPGLGARVGAVASTVNAHGLAVLNQFKNKTSLWGPYRVLIVPISRFRGLQRWRLITVHGELHCICRVVDRAAGTDRGHRLACCCWVLSNLIYHMQWRAVNLRVGERRNPGLVNGVAAKSVQK